MILVSNNEPTSSENIQYLVSLKQQLLTNSKHDILCDLIPSILHKLMTINSLEGIFESGLGPVVRQLCKLKSHEEVARLAKQLYKKWQMQMAKKINHLNNQNSTIFKNVYDKRSETNNNENKRKREEDFTESIPIDNQNTTTCTTNDTKQSPVITQSLLKKYNL